MSTPPPKAATRPPPDPHAHTHDAQTSAEEPAEEGNLFARAGRVLRSRTSAVSTAVRNAGTALLRRLRKEKGGEQGAEDPAAADGAGMPRSGRPLRAFLIYISVLLAGGIGGSVFAYNLLGKMLHQQHEKSRRLAAENSKLFKSAAEARKKFEEAQAKYSALDEEKKRLETMLETERARNAPALRSNDGAARPIKTGNCVADKNNLAALKDCIENFNR